jgi:tetratricopeptide (TPR) repeat protein
MIMLASVPYVRVFLSSPSDVKDERAIAQNVIAHIQRRPVFRGRVLVNVIAWDNPESSTAMDARLTPQVAISQGLPKPSECDIVVVIFWSRIGTPFTDSDGQQFESGTQWELLDGLSSPKTQTYIYHRVLEPDMGNVSDPDFSSRVDQYQRLLRFLKSDLFVRDDKILRSIHDYETPHGFETMFDLHFEEILLRILETSSSKPSSSQTNDTKQLGIEEILNLLTARRLHYTRDQVVELVNNGVFPGASEVDGRMLIPLEAVTAFLQTHRQPRWRARVGRAISVLVVIVTLLGIFGVINDLLDLRERTVQTPTLSPYETAISEGCSQLKSGNLGAAEKDFQEAHTLDPVSAEPWYWLASVAKANGNYDIALTYADNALASAPTHEPTLILKIKTLMVSGNIAEAYQIIGDSWNISTQFDTWLTCIQDNLPQTRPIITASDIEQYCPSSVVDPICIQENGK